MTLTPDKTCMRSLAPHKFIHHKVNRSLLVRLPCGRVLELYLVAGGAGLRSVAVWRWEGMALGAQVAGAC